MAHLLKKKLNSNHGASMILALALFLICTMVSSVIIAAAASGVSRNAQRAEQQSGYLAISSATDLLVEELNKLHDSGKYVGNSQVKRYGCQDCTIKTTMEYFGKSEAGYRLDASYIKEPLDDGHLLKGEPHGENVVTRTPDGSNSSLEGILGALFYRASSHVYIEETSYTEQITIDLANSDDRIPAVTCQFTMDYQYNVSFVLIAEDTDYSATIKANAKAMDSVPQITYISDVDDPEADIHTIYFKKFNSTTGAFEDAMDTNFPIPIKVTTVVTTVEWGIPMIEKGVLSQ